MVKQVKYHGKPLARDFNNGVGSTGDKSWRKEPKRVKGKRKGN